MKQPSPFRLAKTHVVMKNCAIVFYIDKEKKDTVAYRVMPETTLSVNATILLWLHGNTATTVHHSLISVWLSKNIANIENLQ